MNGTSEYLEIGIVELWPIVLVMSLPFVWELYLRISDFKKRQKISNISNMIIKAETMYSSKENKEIVEGIILAKKKI